MAPGISAAVTCGIGRNPFLRSPHRCLVATDCVLLFAPLPSNRCLRPSSISSALQPLRRRSRSAAVCFVVGQNRSSEMKEAAEIESSDLAAEEEEARRILLDRTAEKIARKQAERRTYLAAAVLSSLGITSMAVAAVYYRFYWQMEVGMEFWARWAHRALWHASLWHMHESHHRPRDGPFELNDVFAIINAVPAISLLSFGFFNRGLVPGLCFGAGLGITLFGMAYMFVHDGLVHRRFPVGPIANVPYFRRVAAAHQIHHMDKFDGVPYGLFLGPKELEEVGGAEELQKEINRRIKLYNSNTDTSG
uniref:beta-carotene 3-hydroxylase n=1 Tax=Elaeis guineensis var. tenera TaxID=51953 RepID=A0A8N4F617_ELAGV|nr:beta-carotene hydroxylase 2, chloroplastic isoform X2 [Elaeis guineensis]